MTAKNESDYREVFGEMADQVLALAARIIGRAVHRGVSYKTACHAVKVASYNGMFGAILQTMKLDRSMRSDVTINEAFHSKEDHEAVCHEIVQLMFDHLQAIDRKHVWCVNVAKRELRPGEKIKKPCLPD